MCISAYHSPFLSFSFSCLITVILCHSSSLQVFFLSCLSVFVISCSWFFSFHFLFSFCCHGGQHSAEPKTLVSRHFLRSRKYWLCYLLPITGWRRQWHPTPVLLPGKSLENLMGGGAWWAVVHGVTKSQTRLSNFTFTFHFHALEKKWQPTPVLLPGESQGRGSLVGCRLWGRRESNMTEAT